MTIKNMFSSNFFKNFKLECKKKKKTNNIYLEKYFNYHVLDNRMLYFKTYDDYLVKKFSSDFLKKIYFKNRVEILETIIKDVEYNLRKDFEETFNIQSDENHDRWKNFLLNNRVVNLNYLQFDSYKKSFFNLVLFCFISKGTYTKELDKYNIESKKEDTNFPEELKDLDKYNIDFIQKTINYYDFYGYDKSHYINELLQINIKYKYKGEYSNIDFNYIHKLKKIYNLTSFESTERLIEKEIIASSELKELQLDEIKTMVIKKENLPNVELFYDLSLLFQFYPISDYLNVSCIDTKIYY